MSGVTYLQITTLAMDCQAVLGQINDYLFAHKTVPIFEVFLVSLSSSSNPDNFWRSIIYPLQKTSRCHRKNCWDPFISQNNLRVNVASL